MGEYDFRPQDDFGHSMDDEDDLSNYRPGMGAMVAMGYEPGASAERERHPHRRGFWARLFGDRFGDDGPLGDFAEDAPVEDYVTEEDVYRPRRPAGWGAWQRPHAPAGRMAFRRR